MKKELIQFARDVVLQHPVSPLRKEEEYPFFVNNINDVIFKACSRGGLLLPNLQREAGISVVADFGGEHKESLYQTFCFCIAGNASLSCYNDAFNDIAKQHGILEYKDEKPYPREIAFKKFSNERIKAAIPDLLRISNNLVNGLLINIIVQKDGADFFVKKSNEDTMMLVELLRENGCGDWSPSVVPKLMVVSHVISYILALLANNNQQVTLLMDNDSLIANDVIKNNFVQVFSRCLNHYICFKERINFCIDPDKFRSLPLFPLLCLADVTAGSVENYMSQFRVDENEIDVKQATNDVLLFCCEQGILLKKHNILLKQKGGYWEGSTLSFSAKEFQNDAQVIYI